MEPSVLSMQMFSSISVYSLLITLGHFSHSGYLATTDRQLIVQVTVCKQAFPSLHLPFCDIIKLLLLILLDRICHRKLVLCPFFLSIKWYLFKKCWLTLIGYCSKDVVQSWFSFLSFFSYKMVFV